MLMMDQDGNRNALVVGIAETDHIPQTEGSQHHIYRHDRGSSMLAAWVLY